MIHVWCGGYVFCTQNWNSVPYKAILVVSSVQALGTCCTSRDIHFHILIIDYHYYYNMKLWYTIHWKVKSSRRTYRCKRKWYLRMNSKIFDWRTRVPDDTLRSYDQKMSLFVIDSIFHALILIPEIGREIVWRFNFDSSPHVPSPNLHVHDNVIKEMFALRIISMGIANGSRSKIRGEPSSNNVQCRTLCQNQWFYSFIRSINNE